MTLSNHYYHALGQRGEPNKARVDQGVTRSWALCTQLPMGRILNTANSSWEGLALQAVNPQPSQQASMLPASGCFSAPVPIKPFLWLLRLTLPHVICPSWIMIAWGRSHQLQGVASHTVPAELELKASAFIPPPEPFPGMS